ncbi:uncharacterized protein LOC131153891 [Malania oleifera]|uniref:uncharacterized protein LOC131153891 n=1 Tax=Malania oleifera TaxID=397392 RepID=UPI0025ADC452|nr:uncharacterized protein LOC131153891 [Malania oleifera]
MDLGCSSTNANGDDEAGPSSADGGDSDMIFRSVAQQEDAEAAVDIMTSMVIALSYKTVVLFDSGATHSFVSLGYVKTTRVETQLLDIDLLIVTLTGLVVICERFVSAIQVKRLLQNGCQGYVAYIKEILEKELKVTDILVVIEFSDVLPKELPGLPPDQEIEFAVDLLPRITPISKTLQDGPS